MQHNAVVRKHVAATEHPALFVLNGAAKSLKHLTVDRYIYGLPSRHVRDKWTL